MVAGTVLLDPEGLHMSHTVVMQERTRGFVPLAVFEIVNVSERHLTILLTWLCSYPSNKSETVA